MSYARSGDVAVAYQTIGEGRPGLAFDDRGGHESKGVPGSWRLYAVADG